MGVAVALAGTLQSLSQSEFDGLNNLFQIPFALPWFLLPIPAFTHNHVTDAWIDAGWGCLNADLIYCWTARRKPVAGRS